VTDNAPMIEIDRLVARYGVKTAVDELSLRVPAGEIFAFLGPNGAGKTTTIKVIAGLLRPAAGCLRVAGFDVVREPLAAKSVLSYVPDEPYLYDMLTGREFLGFVADLYGIERARADRELDRLAEAFDIGPWIDELAVGYSHGMRQRIVVAAALLHEPKVLLLDEPLVGLDPKSARRFKDILRREAHGRGAAVFMSTHTLALAEEIGDRVGILNHGRLVKLGTVAEIRALARSPGGGLEDVFLEITEAAGAAGAETGED
jgi:ABC-2 type transport system ATP-binding protein